MAVKANAAAVASPVAGSNHRETRAVERNGLRRDRVASLSAVVERMFQQAGFVTRSQSHGADGGWTYWLTRISTLEASGAVQCKHLAGQTNRRRQDTELKG